MIEKYRSSAGAIRYRNADGESARGEGFRCATALTRAETGALLCISHQAVCQAEKRGLYRLRQMLAAYASPAAMDAAIDRELLICWARRMGHAKLRALSLPRPTPQPSLC